MCDDSIDYVTQLFNIWKMLSLVSKGFGTAVKVGSPVTTHLTLTKIYVYVSFKVELTLNLDKPYCRLRFIQVYPYP